MKHIMLRDLDRYGDMFKDPRIAKLIYASINISSGPTKDKSDIYHLVRIDYDISNAPNPRNMVYGILYIHDEVPMGNTDLNNYTWIGPEQYIEINVDNNEDAMLALPLFDNLPLPRLR